MNNQGRLPYSDERLAKLMGLEPCELTFLSMRDEVKKIVRDYNLFLNSDDAIRELSKIRDRYRSDEMVCDAITNLITCIKLR